MLTRSRCMARGRLHLGSKGSIALFALVLAHLASWPWLDRHIYVYDDYERGQDFGTALRLVYSLTSDSNRLQRICSRAAPLLYGTSEPIKSEVSFLWGCNGDLRGGRWVDFMKD
jgi:hypothetical protein